MEEWKEYKATEFCQTVTDGTHDSPKPKDKGHYLITSKHLKDTGIDFNSANYISEEDYIKIIARSKVEQYDILFSMIGTIGNIVQVKAEDVDFAVKNMGIFKMGKNRLKSSWLLYWLKSPCAHEYVSQRLAGSTQSYLTLSSLRKFPVLYPGDSKANKIVAILKSLDDKIEVNRRINDNLEQQAQALFKSWFVDFEPFRDQPFVESELGMIPEGWRVGTFLDNIYVMPGGTPSTSVDEYWKYGTIPFFSPKDVNGVYCFVTEKSITEAGLNNCSSRLYPKGTLFITARGTVGKLALAGVPMAMNQSNYALVAKEGVGKFYLYLLAQTLVSKLLKKANGAVFSAITTRDFNEPNLMPTNNVMECFEELVKPFFDKIFQTSEESRRLAELRDTLLPRLMSGKIKVEDVTL